ncbi:MAG: flagellar biosynthetic protein FliO [Deltaproteobacteria bacterium]|nr:flagellar biosynthetic protein FliO [Deltaproteobacteria bacterium]
MQDTADMIVQLVRVAGSLAAVLALLLGSLYGIRRWGHWMKRGGANEAIQVIAQHSFGPKHHLLLVQVQEEKLLVGVSPQGMHTLSAISGPHREALSKFDGD